MSEYWKSVPRKFCDFCKCWITDNKPSVEFHERGKRHQENVQKRLKEVRKKSHEQSFEQDQLDREMKKMEQAALEAFKKDLAADPELAKQYGVSLEAKPKPKPDPKSSDHAENQKETKEEESVAEKEWLEAKSPEGYTYYWHTVTGESRWEAPEEYLSIEEQEVEKKKKEEEEEKSKQCEEAADQTEGNASRELKQSLDHKMTGRSAFGAWSVVKEESQPVIYDVTSQPPAPEEIPLPGNAPTADGIPLPKSEGPKFKEKTVKSLGPPSSSGATTFKKRKIASGARNVRKREDDD